MNMAAGTYTALSSLHMSIAAKTGTAQERTTDPDHATLISYAPYDNPEYCMAVRIQNGYAASNAVTLGAEIYKMLFNKLNHIISISFKLSYPINIST